jgi:hypothetical protein
MPSSFQLVADGRASARIVIAFARWLEGERPILNDSEPFREAGSNEQVAA